MKSTPPAVGLAVLGAFVVGLPAAGQTTAAIDIDTTATVPIHAGFSGVNKEIGFPVEDWDYRFNILAAKVGYGWVRFPGGNDSDAYNWQTGEEAAAWVAQFSGDSLGSQLQGTIKDVTGKGGARLIDAANQANLLGATLIVCANGFTDTPESIGQLAAYAQANQIPVAVWELANEAYLYPDFFPTATAYLNKMKPYWDAIKAVDPNAVVAIFVRDLGNTSTQNPWNAAIAAYPNKYWDAISFHHYPPESTGKFAQWMADEHAVLVNRTTTVVTNQLAPIGPPGTKFVLSEFDPSLPIDHASGVTSITNGTLWGGIYAAEFIMRMSTLPSMMYVGAHSIYDAAGVDSANGHYGNVTAAANSGKTVDTLSLDFGFYLSAQANGMAVLNGVVNRAAHSNKTTVAGGATVAATGITQGIPALYAMSYTDANGGLSVVITNKSATPHRVTIRVNGAAATGMFPLQFITGTDPSAANSATDPAAVAIQTSKSANPVTVPPYSVVRVDLKTPAVVTFVNAASHQPAPLAPSQQAIALGSGLASESLTADSDPSPTVLGDTAITITDSVGNVWMVPIYSVSPEQATFLMPDGIVAGTASVTVTRGGQMVATGSLTAAPVSAGIYSANGNGAGVAAATAVAVAADGTTTPLQVFNCQDAVALSCLETPLSLGDGSSPVTLTLSATGIRYAQSVVAYVGGQSVPVQDFGGQQISGLDQVDVTLPATLAGSGRVSVYLVADGTVSNMTTVEIQ